MRLRVHCFVFILFCLIGLVHGKLFQLLSVLQLLICLFQRIKSMMERARYEQQRREEVVFAEEVDFAQCHVDPSPFQLVERTSLLKVIWGLTHFLWGSGVLNLWLQLKLTSQLRTYSHIADYKFSESEM